MSKTLKEQVVDIIERNFKTQSGGDVEDIILEEIQSLDEPLSMEEVVSFCERKTAKICT